MPRVFLHVEVEPWLKGTSCGEEFLTSTHAILGERYYAVQKSMGAHFYDSRTWLESARWGCCSGPNTRATPSKVKRFPLVVKPGKWLSEVVVTTWFIRFLRRRGQRYRHEAATKWPFATFDDVG